VNKWKQFRAVATRYDKRDYIFNGTLSVTAIVIWLRDTVQEPSETASFESPARTFRSSPAPRSQFRHSIDAPIS